MFVKLTNLRRCDSAE